MLGYGREDFDIYCELLDLKGNFGRAIKEVSDQQSHRSINHILQHFFDITIEEGESVANFLIMIKEVKSELTDLGDNIFSDNVVIQGFESIVSDVMGQFTYFRRTFLALNKP